MILGLEVFICQWMWSNSQVEKKSLQQTQKLATL